MSDNHITNVLNILRLIKHTSSPGQTAIHYLSVWAGTANQGSMLRLAVYIVEQCDAANDYILNSRLQDEAKAGLTQISRSLKDWFSLGGIQNDMGSYLPQLETSISTFAILASVFQSDIRTSENADLKDLISEVEAIISLFDDPEISDLVRDVAKRHLHVLLSTLRNVDALGIDAAMAAYAELVVRLRREDFSSPEPSKKKTFNIWSMITKIPDRLNLIDKAVNSGDHLLANGQEVTHHLLSYLS